LDCIKRLRLATMACGLAYIRTHPLFDRSCKDMGLSSIALGKPRVQCFRFCSEFSECVVTGLDSDMTIEV
jgi:hypothetical protein